ncbi:MAG: hypothetical protein JSR11_12120 [Bacteroidetes bacterium]|nr:hypothetical protein [Bacteroidota bacterium]
MDKSIILFPISVDSRRFGTEETVSALNNIQSNCDEMIFLIADGLQVYNKASQIDDGKPLTNIIRNFNLKNDYYSEREKWLMQTIKPQCETHISEVSWTVKNVFSISDNIFHNIYRNVIIAYLAIDDFRNDIVKTAKKHRSKFSQSVTDFALDLSISYIIEEIALNLRMRVIEKIKSEYYLGDLPSPLTNLYLGRYEIDVFTLAGVEFSSFKFDFFHSPNTNKFTRWTRVSL